MKKCIFYLTAFIAIGLSGWIVTGLLLRRDVGHPRPSSASALNQEPVGWVFGRLIGVRQSVYSPFGNVPESQPLRNQP